VGSLVKLVREVDADFCLGALVDGRVGELVHDDGSDLPFKVECRGSSSWYREGQIGPAPPPPPSPGAGGAAAPRHPHTLRPFVHRGYCNVCRERPGVFMGCREGVCDYDECLSCFSRHAPRTLATGARVVRGPTWRCVFQRKRVNPARPFLRNTFTHTLQSRTEGGESRTEAWGTWASSVVAPGAAQIGCK
jgi:hypothetical protein